MKDRSIDFSFSGLKTAVRRRAEKDGIARSGDAGLQASTEVRNLVASFQRAVVDVLVETTVLACRREAVRTVLVAGGVACNRRLRAAFDEAASRYGLSVYFPSPRYTTDNAAMIAGAGFLHLERGERAGLDLNADPNLRL
jgi:N6-L-threonylcarbamoyladenine synthase